MCVDNNTKQNILKISKEQFIAKDYSLVTIKHIAHIVKVDEKLILDEFGSKKLLYDRVFDNVMSDLSIKINEQLNINITFENNIRCIINVCFEMFFFKPQLPLFIFSYLHKHPKKIMAPLNFFNSLCSSEIINTQLRNEFAKGNISLKDTDHFIINLFSLIIYPFTIQKIIYRSYNLSSSTYKTFMFRRKEIIFDIIMSSVKMNFNNNGSKHRLI